MIRVDIEGSREPFERIHSVLSGIPGGFEKAVGRIMPHALTTARDESLKGITRVYDIKAEDVRDRENSTIRVSKRKDGDGVIGFISYLGGKIPLYRFGVSPRSPARQDSRVPVKIGDEWKLAAPGLPVKARLMKSEAMKGFRSAFIASMKSTHTGIFERKNVYSSKITEIMGLSTPQMAQNALVFRDVEEAVLKSVEGRIEGEISRILNGYV